MIKIKCELIVDEDIFDELCSYPCDRVEIINDEEIEVPDEEDEDDKEH